MKQHSFGAPRWAVQEVQLVGITGDSNCLKLTSQIVAEIKPNLIGVKAWKTLSLTCNLHTFIFLFWIAVLFWKLLLSLSLWRRGYRDLRAVLLGRWMMEGLDIRLSCQLDVCKGPPCRRNNCLNGQLFPLQISGIVNFMALFSLQYHPAKEQIKNEYKNTNIFHSVLFKNSKKLHLWSFPKSCFGYVKFWLCIPINVANTTKIQNLEYRISLIFHIFYGSCQWSSIENIHDAVGNNAWLLKHLIHIFQYPFFFFFFK